MLTQALAVMRMRKNGIKVPIIAYQEAKRTGCPLPLLCAVLEQETSGGMNVFGHDPTIFAGAGKVTKAKYLAYKAKRGPHGQGGMQGVGPMQLTYFGYQDRADGYGGAWNPRYNVRVGAHILADSLKGPLGEYGALKAYNGSDAYARQVLPKLAKWKKILK